MAELSMFSLLLRRRPPMNRPPFWGVDKDIGEVMPATGEGDQRALSELRAEIDKIDAEMHRLLMARGAVIDSLIRIKGTSRPGAAFRPGPLSIFLTPVPVPNRSTHKNLRRERPKGGPPLALRA